MSICSIEIAILKKSDESVLVGRGVRGSELGGGGCVE